MKFIVISDIHGDIESVKKLKEKIKTEKCDGIIVAGDIGSLSVLSPLQELNIPIYTILGNDDNPGEKKNFSQFSNIIDIDLKVVKVNGFNIVGCGGAPGGPFYAYNDKEIFKKLDNLFKNLQGPVILVTHCPPKCVLDLATYYGRKHIGSRAIKRILKKYKPLVCFCGHVHKDGGEIKKFDDTIVVNVAGLADHYTFKCRGRRFCIFEITDSRIDIKFDYLREVHSLKELVDKYL
jgi:putative phosphoesterase